MRTRRGSLSVAIATVAVLAIAPAASPAATTIGGDTSTNGDNTMGCSMNPSQTCTVVQTIGHPAPSDGVIVRWRVRGNSFARQFSLRVLQPSGSGFIGGASSAPETVLPGVENIFATSVPIQQGQVIGVDIPGSPDLPIVRTRQSPGSEYRAYPRPGQGEQSGSPYAIGNSQAAVLNVDIEPDCDVDGLGDETQDPDLTTCDTSSPDTTITANPSVKTKKKTATFEFSGADARVVAGFECSLDDGAFASCTSPHTVKVGKGKHTFSVRAVDAAGNRDASAATYSWKVKKKKRKK